MKRSSLIAVLVLGLVPVAGLVVWLVHDGHFARFFSAGTRPETTVAQQEEQITRNPANAGEPGQVDPPVARGFLAVEPVALFEKPANTARVLERIPPPFVLTNSATNGWIPVRFNRSAGWVASDCVEPFTSPSGYRALLALLGNRGERSGLDAIKRTARALADCDRQTLRTSLADTITIFPPGGRNKILSRHDFSLLEIHKRILWLPDDRPLTLNTISRRARSFLKHPIMLTNTSTRSNASGLRLGLIQLGGRWLVDRILLDNTHPLLLD